MAKQTKRPTKAEKTQAAPTAEVALSFDSPESSLILRGCYDPGTRTLEVEFTSGKTYTYAGVTPECWISMLMAESKGKFFNTTIRPFVLGRVKL